MKLKTHALDDVLTGRTIGQYASLKAAYRVADRKDLEYGAVRYVVRRLQPQLSPVYAQNNRGE